MEFHDKCTMKEEERENRGQLERICYPKNLKWVQPFLSNVGLAQEGNTAAL